MDQNSKTPSAADLSAADPGPESPSPEDPSPEDPGPREPTPCVNHPAVAAVVECELCGSAICETCDFDFSGHHACPACAVAEKEKPPEGMKPMLLSAYVLAAVTSLILLVVMLSGESWDENLAGCVFSLMLVASIAGTVLSVSAKGRARRRSLADKVAIAWNFAVLLTLGLFTVLGLMMES